MTRIFISYRRADSRKDAGRIYDRLVEAFGKENIFKDVDNIPMGRDFRGVLREAVAQCDVLLAIIGRQWLDIQDENGNRRLDNPGDFVRIEIESGLQRDSCLVIPVLVDNAPMPRPDNLPPDLRELAFKHATIVRDDPDFHHDVSRIIRELGGATTTRSISESRSFDVHAAISDYYRAYDAQDWERARQILADIRNSPTIPRVFNVDLHEQAIWQAIEVAERDQEYEVLKLMAERGSSQHVWEALQVFWQNFPDYDPENIGDRVRPKPKRPRSLDLMPAPFDWIEIPAGQVRLEKGGYLNAATTFDVPAFAIGKYPITNAQFAKFIEAGGYRERRWWTDAGWEAREQGWHFDYEAAEWKPSGQAWTEPRFWRDSQWNGANQPVVGVSWYEAIAFCQWLSEMSGEPIMLPTEQQWQRAAQGDDGRTYPWGQKWDCQRCNNSVNPCDSNQTSPVTAYEGRDKGDSPFGVVDMAGNVWEWCLTTYEDGKNSEVGDNTNMRVLRGGSWFGYHSNNFRAAFRSRNYPDNRDNDAGFRVSRSSF